jgi:hypothetical protein
VAEGDANKERLAALLRYQSSYTIGKDEKALTSLEDYVSRMKKNQKVFIDFPENHSFHPFHHLPASCFRLSTFFRAKQYMSAKRRHSLRIL